MNKKSIKNLSRKDLENEVVKLRCHISKLEGKEKEHKKKENESERLFDELRNSEKKFRLFFNNSPHYCYIISPDGKILDLNKNALKRLGYKKKEIVGKPLLTTVYANDSMKKARKLLRQWKQTGVITEEKLKIVTKSGKERIVRLNAIAVRNREGEVLHSLSVQQDITEEKETELALKKEMEVSSSIIQTAQTIILVLDTKGKIVSVNPYMEEISGYKLKQVKGKDWFETFLPKNERRGIKALFKKAVSNIQTRGNITSIVTRKGEIRRIEWYDKTLKDSDGKTLGLLAVGQDVTERIYKDERLKHINAVLLSMQKSLRLISRENDSGILLQRICENLTESGAFHSIWVGLINKDNQVDRLFYSNTRGKTKHENMVSKGMLGGKCRKVLKTGGLISFCDPMKICLDCPFAKNFSGQRGQVARLEHKKKIFGVIGIFFPPDVSPAREDKNLLHQIARDLGFSLYSLENEKRRTGMEQRIRKINRELIEGQQQLVDMNRKLVENEELFRRLFELAPIGIAVLNKEKIIFINKAGAGILGVSNPTELAGQPHIGFIHPEGRDTVMNRFEIMEKQNTGVPILEERMVRMDGTIIQVESISTPLPSGKERRFLSVFTDVSEKKKLASERIMMEERLHHIQKMEAIGQLAGGVAHDFNNLLGGIMGYADILGNKFKEDDTVRKYICNIIDAAEKGAGLTYQLLSFARKGSFVSDPVDVHQVIRRTVDLLEHSLDKRIAIQTELVAEPSFVAGDETRLANAILNLAINAGDAMPEGGQIVIQTDIAVLDEETIKRENFIDCKSGRYLKIIVSDTGCGMDQEIIDHIFEPFFTTKEVGKGTGLGLASVYGCVKLQKGCVRVESKINQGTSFILYLPLAEKEEKKKRNTSIDPNIKHRGHILLIDDDSAIREIGSELFSILGYKVTACEDGEKGLKYFKENHHDINIVVLDLIMPVVNGYDCYYKISKINPNIPVIISSGYAADSRIRKLLSSGVKAFLKKPYNSIRLVEALMKVEGECGIGK